MFGRETVQKYGGVVPTVAYAPSSWGQTGQLPQILRDFSIDKMMFYRGISPDEADSEYIWRAPDGSEVLTSRFAVYARYNWYYFVHRNVTRDQFMEREYSWGKSDEVPFCITDDYSGSMAHFSTRSPSMHYDKTRLRQSIDRMIETEGRHFTTEVFLAMNGHDFSVPHVLESEIMKDAAALYAGQYDIEHTSLEEHWKEVEKHIDRDALRVLVGERRSYLKTGLWTTLMPDSISARTYLKQMDFRTTTQLVYLAEPLTTMALHIGARSQRSYLHRGWRYLLQNHTHDANGGHAPDIVCKDMEYRYRKSYDIANIAAEDAMAFVAENLSPVGMDENGMNFVVYNPLPFERDVIVKVDLDIPDEVGPSFLSLESEKDETAELQLVAKKHIKQSIHSKWDVPCYMNVTRFTLYAELNQIPAVGYRAYTIKPIKDKPRSRITMISGPDSMENMFLKVELNPNGTVTVTEKRTDRCYRNLNYLTDEGEVGDTWEHAKPFRDEVFNTLGANARIVIEESGPLASTISAYYDFAVPADCPDKQDRSKALVDIPVKVSYTLEKHAHVLKIKTELVNNARNHRLRANFPTEIPCDVSVTDSHFDVLSHPIKVPDSTGWVEEARGSHPMRTFVDVSDGERGLGLFTKGIFEYKVHEDERRTLALTLLRACDARFLVGGEFYSMPDVDVQSLGKGIFEYALCFHQGDWASANLLNEAAEYYAPVRSAISGRGKGTLKRDFGLLSLDNRALHVTCIKQSEDREGTIIRLFNPMPERQDAVFRFAGPIQKAWLCRMDESETEELKYEGTCLKMTLPKKKIVTIKVLFS